MGASQQRLPESTSLLIPEDIKTRMENTRLAAVHKRSEKNTYVYAINKDAREKPSSLRGLLFDLFSLKSILIFLALSLGPVSFASPFFFVAPKFFEAIVFENTVPFFAFSILFSIFFSSLIVFDMHKESLQKDYERNRYRLIRLQLNLRSPSYLPEFASHEAIKYKSIAKMLKLDEFIYVDEISGKWSVTKVEKEISRLNYQRVTEDFSTAPHDLISVEDISIQAINFASMFNNPTIAQDLISDCSSYLELIKEKQDDDQLVLDLSQRISKRYRDMMDQAIHLSNMSPIEEWH